MNMEFEYLKDKDIVLVKTSGIYNLTKEIESAKEMVSKLKEHNCNRCLIDHRDSKIISPIVDVYNRPKEYTKIGVERSLITAIVFKKLNDDLQFYEEICQSRGWNIAVFDDYDAAITWLIK